MGKYAASMATCALMLMLTRIEYRRLAVDRSVGLANVGCHFDRKLKVRFFGYI